MGYDGSENSERALGRGIQLAKQSKGMLRVVVVADTMSYSTYASAGMYKSFSDRAKESARSLAKSALAEAKAAGVVNAYASEEEGQPADLILTLAIEYKADLIVVGRRGMRSLTRFLMGSVSNAVINHAKCDVLIVK